MINTVIFDMDGVISDTERVRFSIVKRLLEKKGIKVNDAKKFDLLGNHTIDFLRTFYSHALTEKEMHEIRNEVILNYHNNIKPIPGIKGLCEWINNKGLKMGVATGSSSASAQKIIATLNLTKYFSAVVTADQVINQKPNPEIYSVAALRLGRNPKECLAIEDSDIGISSAKAAGIKTIGITTSHRKEDLKHADYVVDKLVEVKDIILANL